MRKQYKILYFHPEFAQIGVKFEGYDCYNFTAPFRDGAYLSGKEFEDHMETLYLHAFCNSEEIAPSLTGGEYIQSLVVVNNDPKGDVSE